MKTLRYQAIADAMADDILTGALSAGSQLPTVRALMRNHGVALATASRVYATLAAAGLTTGEQGRGTFVRDTSVPRGSALRQDPLRSDLADLSFNYPTLPRQADMLRDGLRRVAMAGDLDVLLHSAPQGGRTQDRVSAAKHLRNRGIRVPDEQVLIVNGAQQGLAVTVMALLRPGDVMAIDALTYPGMKALAHAHRLTLLPVRQEGGRSDWDGLAALCKRHRVGAVYTMPTLHNPLGSVMSASDRKALADLAERHDFVIIEDGAYAFLGEPAPRPIFTLAPHRTVYVSGLSKSVASGLRIGFVAASAKLLPDLEQAIRVSSWQTPSVTAALARLWIEDGEVDALEDEKRIDARTRQKVARAALSGLEVRGHASSYFLWLPLPPGARAESVVASLRDQGILVGAATPFATTPHVPDALRVALGSVHVSTLSSALRAVRETILQW